MNDANDGPSDWDRVDEASWESFPASDPPSSWAGSDRAPAPPSGTRAAGEADARWPSGAQRLFERWRRSAVARAARPLIRTAAVKAIGSARSLAARLRQRSVR